MYILGSWGFINHHSIPKTEDNRTFTQNNLRIGEMKWHFK